MTEAIRIDDFALYPSFGPDRGSHAAHLHYAGAGPAVDQLWANSGVSHDEVLLSR